MIRLQTHIITPKDSGFLILGLSSNNRAIIFKPLLHHLGGSPKGTEDRFLEAEVPTGKLPSQSLFRKPDHKSFLDKLTYGVLRPIIKRQPQGLCGTVNNRLGKLLTLRWQKRPASKESSFPFYECSFRSFSLGFDPLDNCLERDTGNFTLLDAIHNTLNRLVTTVRLCNSRRKLNIFDIYARVSKKGTTRT